METFQNGSHKIDIGVLIKRALFYFICQCISMTPSWLDNLFNFPELNEPTSVQHHNSMIYQK
jgi:hypothetical protein